MYADSFEKKNTAYLGCGIVINKYSGSRGKSGSNDANAEYIAHIRNLLEEEKVVYQTAELGRVDLGGGGTIAYILALYGMNVIDCGVAVMSMHSPWEAISKADLYETKDEYCLSIILTTSFLIAGAGAIFSLRTAEICKLLTANITFELLN